MANTTSLNFPNLFNVSQNTVAVVEDTASIVNRTRLMMLTQPTELYNNPNFGLGLKEHLWKYNNGNEQEIIKDKLIHQLRLHEPCVIPEDTQLIDGLLYSGTSTNQHQQDYNSLKLTAVLSTVYGDKLNLDIHKLAQEIFGTSSEDS